MAEKPRDIKVILAEAIEKPTAKERSAYLDRACRDAEDLRREVESLLRLEDRMGDFLETPIFDNGLTLDDSPISEGPGTVIGCYKLLEKIGEGGMAVVYMAEQEEPIRRKVALKIIKLGMDTKSVIARFEAERQALAMMDHPNIARVLDAGATETGRPYFVMELVTGVSITEYCDKNSLSTKERLVLFIQVCNAVQHAHQKGIIHRDIKPTNVMVTQHEGTPVPKVIDFGIAKATKQRLTEKTLFTRYAHIIGTPAYMSPEQADLSDLDVDTRSDIYSLGVLLYELLTGTTPFSEQELRKAGYIEMQRVIREQEPPKPSTKLSILGETLTDVAKYRASTPDLLTKAIRGDLDWIVMKSLEKSRTQRYTTVSELTSDVHRHLNSEPVLASPPSKLYQMKKFVRRHRASVTLVAAISVGFVVSTAMFLRADRAGYEAKRQTELADRACAEAQTMTDFLTNDLLASVYPENAKSQEVTVRYLLDRAVKSIDQRLKHSPLSEAKVRETIGLAYQKMGDYKAAEPHLDRALEIRSQQLGDEDTTTLASLSDLGKLYTIQGQYEKAETVLESALSTRIRVLGEEHPDTLQSMNSLAEFHLYRTDFKKAHPLLIKVRQVGSGVLGEEHPILLDAMLGHVYLLIFSFQHDRAYPLATKGLETSRRVLGEDHEITLGFMSALVCIYREQKRYDEGKELSSRALEIGQRVFGQEHPATMEAMSQLGDLYVIEGRYEEAA
ncbi:MAG: serine/threonine-protein kinase, partial [Planctomycetota bacterium]|nr:serine/threonine-protein kinase [Planctomycetota bacterium]